MTSRFSVPPTTHLATLSLAGSSRCEWFRARETSFYEPFGTVPLSSVRSRSGVPVGEAQSQTSGERTSSTVGLQWVVGDCVGVTPTVSGSGDAVPGLYSVRLSLCWARPFSRCRVPGRGVLWFHSQSIGVEDVGQFRRRLVRHTLSSEFLPTHLSLDRTTSFP